MNSAILKVLGLVLVTSLCSSCSKDVASYEETDDSAAGNTVLKVKTRAADSSDGTVSSPINIYVFNSKDKCVAYKQTGSTGSDASFKLTEGDYKVYSIAGADAETYDLPTMDDATIESVVSVKAGKRHGNIMAAQNQVALKNDIDSDVSLAMSRKVLMLTNVTIKDVPDGIASITASISPLYENIRLDGEYSGKTGAVSVELEKEGSTTTWKNDCNLYMLPSVGNPLIKFTFKSTDGSTRTFTYLSEKPLRANYKISMNVNYVKIKEPTLKCVITGVEWNENDEWSFDANEKDFTSDEGNTEEPTPDNPEDNNIPKVGELYKGCYVLKSETTGNTTTLTLIGPKTRKGPFTYNVDDQQSIKDEVNAVLGQMTINGISELRLPTFEEMQEIKTYYSDLNKKLNSLGLDNIPLSTNFLATKSDNSIINFSTGSWKDISMSTKCNLRPFATVKITK